MTENTLVQALGEYQDRVSKAEGRQISDSEFQRRFLNISASTLSRLRTGTYNGNFQKVSAQLERDFADIDMRIDQLSLNANIEKGFVETVLARSVISAVNRARDGRSRRIVVVLSDTGAGKTETGQFLQSKGAVYVEGRNSWAWSYKAFCADVATAAGRPIKVRDYDEHSAESAMLDALSSKDGILYIDEANRLGGRAVDAIKLIVNQTGYSVVIAAIPSFWDSLIQRASAEVRQLVNRCQPIIRCSKVEDKDSRKFLASVLHGDTLDYAVREVTDAAMEFGAYSTVVAVRDALQDMESPTREDVDKVLKTLRVSWERAGVATNHKTIKR